MVNMFLVIDCKMRKVLFATLSASKAKDVIKKGLKVEVWLNGILSNVIYSNELGKFNQYILQEKEYIRERQRRAEERNKLRRRSKITN